MAFDQKTVEVAISLKAEVEAEGVVEDPVVKVHRLNWKVFLVMKVVVDLLLLNRC